MCETHLFLADATIQLPAVVACGGTWMVKPDMIAAGDFDTITTLSAEAVAAAASS